MIKTDDRNLLRTADRDRFPANLIWIARFDNVRPFLFQNFFDGAKIQQCPVARRAREQRGVNRVNARPAIAGHLCFLTGNDENVFGSRRVLLDVRDLLVNIAFHAAAQWRIELSQIADFHRICALRFAICDLNRGREAVFFDDAMIATISPASVNKGLPFAAASKSVSIINSSQKALSSASSSTTPSFAMNSGFERARHAAR